MISSIIRKAMKSLPISFILSLSLTQLAIAGIKTDRALERLKGPVLSVRIEIVDYSNKSGQWVEDHKFVQTERYDRQGNVIERITYNSNGSVKLKEKQINTYDDQGRITEQSVSALSSGKSVYRYNSKNNAVEEVRHRADGSISGRTIYVFDKNGNISKQFNYWTAGNAYDSKDVFKYGSDGKLIEKDQYISDISGDKLMRKITISSDNKGNERMISFKEDGSIVGDQLTTYDANGNISEIFYDKPDLLKGKTTYTYEYDPVGNWIQKKEIHEGKVETLEVTHRTITYYPDDKTP